MNETEILGVFLSFFERQQWLVFSYRSDGKEKELMIL